MTDKEKLEQILQLIANFGYVRTNITAVSGYAELIEIKHNSDELDDEFLDYVIVQVKENIKIIAETTNELLNEAQNLR